MSINKFCYSASRKMHSPGHSSAASIAAITDAEQGLASGQAPVSVHSVKHLLNGFRPVRMGEDPELL